MDSISQEITPEASAMAEENDVADEADGANNINNDCQASILPQKKFLDVLKGAFEEAKLYIETLEQKEIQSMQEKANLRAENINLQVKLDGNEVKLKKLKENRSARETEMDNFILKTRQIYQQNRTKQIELVTSLTNQKATLNNEKQNLILRCSNLLKENNLLLENEALRLRRRRLCSCKSFVVAIIAAVFMIAYVLNFILPNITIVRTCPAPHIEFELPCGWLNV